MSSNFLSWVSLELEYSEGTEINLLPQVGQEPDLVDLNRANLSVTFRPSNSVRNENVYLLERLFETTAGRSPQACLRHDSPRKGGLTCGWRREPGSSPVALLVGLQAGEVRR